MLNFLVLALILSNSVTLEQTPCTGTTICYDVTNNSNLNIDYLSYSSHYRRLTVSINNTIYDSGLWATTAVITVNAPTSVASLANVPLYGPNSDILYVTVNISTTSHPCVQSGRVAVCPVTVILQSGTISSSP